MLDFVFNATAVSLRCIAPIMFRNELAQRAVGRKKAVSDSLEPYCAPALPRAPGVLSIHSVFLWLDLNTMRHRHAGILLSIAKPGCRGNCELRNQLTNEDHAALLFSPYIETEIHLFKRTMKWNPKSSEARVETRLVELKPYEAHIGAAIESIEFGARGNKWLKQAWIDRVVQHRELLPLCCQKHTWLLHWPPPLL